MRKFLRILDEGFTAAVVLIGAIGLFLVAHAAEIPNTSVFSQTDGSNNTGTVPSWAEGQAPSTVNDSARALQGAITRAWNWDHPTITSGGSANVQTLTFSVAPAAYYNGQRFCFEAGFSTSGASTLNVNTLGAIAIKYLSAGALTDTTTNTIRAGDRPCVTYRSTGPSFVIEGGLSLGMTNPMTTQGDVIYGGASGTPTRLAVGTSNQILRSDGTNPDWESINTIISGTHTIWVPAGAMIPETTTGCASGTVETASNQVMYKTLDCDGAGSLQEGAQFLVGMPKSTNEGTVTFQVSWTAASGSGDVIWLLSCLARSNDDAIDTAFGTEVSVTDTLLSAGDVHQTSVTSAVTPSGTWAEGDDLWCRIQRDGDNASDTLNNVDARLIGVRALYPINAVTDD